MPPPHLRKIFYISQSPAGPLNVVCCPAAMTSPCPENLRPASLLEQEIAREDMAGKVPIDSHSPYFLFQELSQAPWFRVSGGRNMRKVKGQSKSTKMLTLFIIHNRYHFVLLPLSSQGPQPAPGESKGPALSLDHLPRQVVIQPTHKFLIAARDRELTTRLSVCHGRTSTVWKPLMDFNILSSIPQCHRLGKMKLRERQGQLKVAQQVSTRTLGFWLAGEGKFCTLRLLRT